MEVRTVELALRGFGAPPARAVAELDVLNRQERLKRAALTFGAGLVAALIALPIPLVHFVFVPAALITGASLALLRLRQGEVFRGVSASCPICGKEQRFTVMGRFRLPRKLHCESCHHQLELDAATTSPRRSPT
jgi:hypothetical protein